MASKWISFDDLIARWGIVDFELLDYLKQGLPIYGSFLQRMYEVRPGEAGYDYSLREEPYRIEFPFMNFEMPEDTQMALRKLSNLKTCLFKMEDVLNLDPEHGMVPQGQPASSTSPNKRSSQDDRGNINDITTFKQPDTDQASPKPPFTHSDDFRTIVKDGVTYTLTLKQAKVIEILFSNYMKGVPEVGHRFILEEIYGPKDALATRIRDIFKGNRDTRNALTEEGRRKGILRLKS